MALVINGDNGEIGIYVEKVPTGVDGWFDIILQTPSTSFFQVLKSLVKRPTIRIRNVPESSILGPIIVGAEDEQKQVMILTQGENGQSKLFDKMKILHSKEISILRQQLADELVRIQAADEEKRIALSGAKQTHKMVDDLKTKPARRYPFGTRPTEENQDEQY
jgi:hypothetical protein